MQDEDLFRHEVEGRDEVRLVPKYPLEAARSGIGIDLLEVQKDRYGKYSPRVRALVIQLCRETDFDTAWVARLLDINIKTVGLWLHHYRWGRIGEDGHFQGHLPKRKNGLHPILIQSSGAVEQDEIRARRLARQLRELASQLRGTGAAEASRTMNEAADFLEDYRRTDEIWSKLEEIETQLNTVKRHFRFPKGGRHDV